MIIYRSSWVVPISGPPIRDGWVALNRGRVVALGALGALGAVGPPEASHGEDSVTRDLGDVAIMPGLVNAHTHLELSYLRGAVPPASRFVTWIGELVSRRRLPDDAAASDIMASVEQGINEAVASGSALVGDISNTLVTFEPLTRSPLSAVVFYELLRFSEPDPERFVEQACQAIDALAPTDSVRASLAAHAPYSVSPLVFRAIRRAIDRRPFLPSSVHLAESAEEVQFIGNGGGPWRAMLEHLGAWDPSWVAPAVSPVRYLQENGFLDGRVVVVHGVQMSADDLGRLAGLGATLVTCPRSNQYTGAGTPPLDAFYASGVRVAVGTDSLASAPDLNVFSELAAMRGLTASVPASVLLDSATRQGARALGFESDLGSIEPGKRARLLAVDVPPRTDDVEEYLVSGIRPEQVKWIET